MFALFAIGLHRFLTSSSFMSSSKRLQRRKGRNELPLPLLIL